MKWRIYLCHLCMLSILILCILQFKTNKKNVNKKSEWHKITSLLFMLVGCSITLVFEIYIYIYISAILTFGVWLMFLLFFSDRGESKQESIRGTLHYLFEGVMPFLQVNVHWGLPCRSLLEDLHMFSQSSDFFWFIDWNCKFICK